MTEALNRDETLWGSYDGRDTLVKDLDVRHLVNIMNHVRVANIANERAVYSARLIQLLEAEAGLRIMAGWAKDIGIPRRNEDGTWELINQTEQERAIEDARTLLHQQEMEKSPNQRLSAPELFAKMHEIQGLTTLEICN